MGEQKIEGEKGERIMGGQKNFGLLSPTWKKGGGG